MKALVSAFILFVMAGNIKAQETAAPYKQISGRYGVNEGICIFEDGSFMLYGYATAVFGHFKLENNKLLFYPDRPALFEVYATHNKSLKTGTRINFVQFDGAGPAFVKLGKAPSRQVFNNDANCFSGPFVYNQSDILTEFTLAAQPEEIGKRQAVDSVYHYFNQKVYNDFILIYNQPRHEYQDFAGILETNADKWTALKLSNYGGNEGYYKNKDNEDEHKQWQEVLEMKRRYEEAKHNLQQGAMVNNHYNTFIRNTDNYDYDATQNLYISKTAANDREYYEANPYSDDRYLRRYVKIHPHLKSNIGLPDKGKSKATVFFSTCGKGAEKSYRYKGLPEKKYLNPGEMSMPTTIAPVPVPDNNGSKKPE